MLAFDPVVFDAYRAVRPTLRWTLQNLCAFAERSGRCFPSGRKLAAVAGISKSTASRHLAELARDGIVTRRRRPGGYYAYAIAARFLPAAREVSHKRDRAVPSPRTEENPGKKTERFAKLGMTVGELPDPTDQWRSRIRSWRGSRGKFWLDAWGARPGEAGCMVPAALLTG